MERKSLKARDWREAALFVAGCQAAGFVTSGLGGAFKRQDWYDNTLKPWPWPPRWVFPTAWVGNYTFMGLAIWQVWRQRHNQPVGSALGSFGLHLLHNFSFIPLVYRVKKRSFYTFMDGLAVLSGLATISRVSKVSPPAARLMLPYLGWLFFTTFLKFRWWRLEKKPVAQQTAS